MIESVSQLAVPSEKRTTHDDRSINDPQPLHSLDFQIGIHDPGFCTLLTHRTRSNCVHRARSDSLRECLPFAFSHGIRIRTNWCSGGRGVVRPDGMRVESFHGADTLLEDSDVERVSEEAQVDEGFVEWIG